MEGAKVNIKDKDGVGLKIVILLLGSRILMLLSISFSSTNMRWAACMPHSGYTVIQARRLGGWGEGGGEGRGWGVQRVRIKPPPAKKD